MGINSIIQGSPYWGDRFDSTKGYRHLAWQVKKRIQGQELNEMQELLFNYLKSLADATFKEGSVIEGCP